MEWWTHLRVRSAQEGISKRQLCREEGIGWGTLEKVLAHPEPPGYRRSAPYPAPKLGPFVARIAQILDDDQDVDPEQPNIKWVTYANAPTQGRYIRITSDADESWASMHEFRVYAAPRPER